MREVRRDRRLTRVMTFMLASCIKACTSLSMWMANGQKLAFRLKEIKEYGPLFLQFPGKYLALCKTFWPSTTPDFLSVSLTSSTQWHFRSQSTSTHVGTAAFIVSGTAASKLETSTSLPVCGGSPCCSPAWLGPLPKKACPSRCSELVFQNALCKICPILWLTVRRLRHLTLWVESCVGTESREAECLGFTLKAASRCSGVSQMHLLSRELKGDAATHKLIEQGGIQCSQCSRRLFHVFHNYLVCVDKTKGGKARNLRLLFSMFYLPVSRIALSTQKSEGTCGHMKVNFNKLKCNKWKIPVLIWTSCILNAQWPGELSHIFIVFDEETLAGRSILYIDICIYTGDPPVTLKTVLTWRTFSFSVWQLYH